MLEDELIAVGVQPYSYLFTHTPSYSLPSLGAYHAAELRYVFDLFRYINITQGEASLTKFMMNFWSTFAKTGNPNFGGGEHEQWPIFDTSNQRLVLDVELSVVNVYKTDECKFWQQFY